MRSNIFWSSIGQEKAKSPIELPGRPGLSVVPYVRRRLSFAQLAAAALETGRFDRLVVDLPRFLSCGELLELSHSVFPMVFSMVVRKGPDRHLLLPFVPNDAGYLATFAARRNRVRYECVDVENLLFHPESSMFSPDLPLRDDFFALSEGPQNYFAPLWSRMDAMWEEMPLLRKAFTAARASIVASRLEEALASGERTLFVCEYRLWWAVRKVLEGVMKFALVPSPPSQEELGVAFVAEDPYHLWTMGFLDDYPAVNLKFFEAVRKKKARSFDKLEALGESLIESLRREDPKVATGKSIRRFLSFARYLKARLIASGRIVPLPAAHFLDAAESCFGQEAAKELAKTLLAYPVPEEKARKKGEGFYSLTPDGALKGGDAFDIPETLETGDYYGGDSGDGPGGRQLPDDPDRESWADVARQVLTRTEVKLFQSSRCGVVWAVKDDYVLHQNACSLMRDNISRDARRSITKRSWGSMGNGVDWKATLRAKARGEKAIYVRKLRSDTRFLTIDEYTPHAFLLSEDIEGCESSTIHDANLAQRQIWLGNDSFPFHLHPKPDMVYSFFKTVRRTEFFLDGHLRREENTALSFLYTKSHMGVERYEAINRKARRHQCRLEPGNDPDLADFSLAEKMVAWPIKYAERAVVVVCYQDWSLTEKVARFAREKNVKIIVVPLSTLAPSLVRRLRTTYLVSTALKKYPDRDKVLRRFVA